MFTFPSAFTHWFVHLTADEQAAAADAFKLITGGTLSPYSNPKPVAVALVPVDTDQGRRLLGVRRAIEPNKGRVALPGGFLKERLGMIKDMLSRLRGQACLWNCRVLVGHPRRHQDHPRPQRPGAPAVRRPRSGPSMKRPVPSTRARSHPG